MGRIPQACAERRAPDGGARLDRRQWRSRQLFVPLAGCAASRPGGGSASKWCNQEFDALINRAATLASQAERTKLYEQAQVIMHQEAPFFLIAHSVVFMPMRKEVTGYKMSPFGRHQFDQVGLPETQVLRFLIRRVGLVVPTFVAVTFLSFLLIHLVPGDPIETRS